MRRLVSTWANVALRSSLSVVMSGRNDQTDLTDRNIATKATIFAHSVTSKLGIRVNFSKTGP